MRGWCVLAAVAACGHSSPGVGSWTDGVPLPAPRFEAYAALVGGQIYYLGGIAGFGTDPANSVTSTEVDVFDPVIGTWTAGPPLPSGCARHHLAVAVVGEQIYVLGGFDGILFGRPGEPFIPIAQTWVLGGGQWRRLADQPIARGAATAQAIDGKIYVAGGGPDDEHPLGDVWMYDPTTDTWAEKAPLPTPRQHLASCSVDGKLLAVGGWTLNHFTLATAELYDPGADKWTTLPAMATDRGGLGAIALGSTCYVIGGERFTDPLPSTRSDVEAYDVSHGRWSTLTAMPTARHGIGVAALDGEIYVVGGGPIEGTSFTDVVEVFAP